LRCANFGDTDKHCVTSTDLCHVIYTESTEKKTIVWPKFLTFDLARWLWIIKQKLDTKFGMPAHASNFSVTTVQHVV